MLKKSIVTLVTLVIMLNFLSLTGLAKKADKNSIELIQGYVLLDVDDESLITSQTPKQGIKVTLMRENKTSRLNSGITIIEYTPIAETITEKDGYYSFSVSEFGNYRVSIKDEKTLNNYDISNNPINHTTSNFILKKKPNDINQKRDEEKIAALKTNSYKKIQYAYEQGLIDYETKINLYLKALKKDKSLPAHYASDSSDGLTLDAKFDLKKYVDDSTKSAVMEQELEFVIMAISQSSSNYLLTSHFAIYYVETGDEAISDTTDTTPLNDVPDVVDQIGTDLEAIYSKLCGTGTGEFGFNEPRTQACYTDTGYVTKIPVMLEETPGQSLGVTSANTGNPLTPIDTNYDYNNYYTTISYDIDLVNEIIPSGSEAWLYNGTTSDFSGFRKSVFAHELFHSVQCAHNADMEMWFKEATANYMMEKVYPAYYNYESSLDRLLDDTNQSLDDADVWYGNSLFAFHLAEEFDGVDTIKDIMNSHDGTPAEDYTDTYAAIDYVIQTESSNTEDFESVYHDFVIKNYRCSDYYNDYNSDWETSEAQNTHSGEYKIFSVNALP